MSNSPWENLAARSNGLHVVEDFEAATYRLVVEQVLYHADRGSRTAYYVVERYERDIKDALAPLGVDVHVNRQLRYTYAIPRHGKSGNATTQQTVFALVLRMVYEDSAKVGDLTDDGEVICDLVELEEKYRMLTGRELPGKGELDSLIRNMRRWGIARLSSEQDDIGEEGLLDQPYAIVIRPAIVDILGETALQRLSQWHGTTLSAPDECEAQEQTPNDGTEMA
jgi:hypothetical protein